MIVNITVFLIGALSVLGLEFLVGITAVWIYAERKESKRNGKEHSNNSDDNK